MVLSAYLTGLEDPWGTSLIIVNEKIGVYGCVTC
jgi:hypothetical protein